MIFSLTDSREVGLDFFYFLQKENLVRKCLRDDKSIGIVLLVVPAAISYISENLHSLDQTNETTKQESEGVRFLTLVIYSQK